MIVPKWLFKPEYSRWELLMYGFSVSHVATGRFISASLFIALGIIVQFYANRSKLDENGK